MRSNDVDEAVAGPCQNHDEDQVHGLPGCQQVCVGPESLHEYQSFP